MDAYFDCFSGISGDMVLGAFLDLGVSETFLKKEISSINIGNFDIVKKVTTRGIRSTNCFVICPKKSKSLSYNEITDLVRNSNLSTKTKQISIKIFHRIAVAESKIHGCNINQVCFHEIGAIDSIIDIIGTAICLEYMNIENIFSSKLPLGNGFINCSHGILPLPSPATLEMLKGIPVYGSKINGELITPTGAGILVSLSKSFGTIPNMIIKRIGYGCGKRNQPFTPNLLRIILGKVDKSKYSKKTHSVSIIEANIDDMNPEIYSFLIKKIFDIGALDVCFIPLTMKKNRPGIKIEITCFNCLRDIIVDELFSQTTTLGIKYYSVIRKTLKRSSAQIQTKLGSVRVKLSIQKNGKKRYIPEYEVCKNIAIEKNMSIISVYDIITKAICGIESS